MKKIIIVTFLCLFFSTGLFSLELGVIGGNISNPSHLNYGLSGSFGFLIPMVKFEFEYTRQADAEELEYPNTFTGAIKFRPAFGRLMPYGVLGIGTDFRSFNLDFDEYESFTFIGGGIYYKMMAVFSIRADIRFLNFSGYNRTRLSAGIFIHI
ncbi:MAG: hypothetical protein PVH61_07565 [Candidatus Aminicenantes bacterium]|jgi:hypothetical protein